VASRGPAAPSWTRWNPSAALLWAAEEYAWASGLRFTTQAPGLELYAASRRGEFNALLALLDPEVVLRADVTAIKLGACRSAGRRASPQSSWAGRGARPALVNGTAGAVRLPGGRPRAVFALTIQGGTITGIDLIADPDRLRRIDLVIPGECSRTGAATGFCRPDHPACPELDFGTRRMTGSSRSVFCWYFA
jgi:hypothetical protein